MMVKTTGKCVFQLLSCAAIVTLKLIAVPAHRAARLRVVNVFPVETYPSPLLALLFSAATASKSKTEDSLFLHPRLFEEAGYCLRMWSMERAPNRAHESSTRQERCRGQSFPRSRMRVTPKAARKSQFYHFLKALRSSQKPLSKVRLVMEIQIKTLATCIPRAWRKVQRWV